MLGWSASNFAFGCDNNSGFGKSKLVPAALTVVLLTLIFSVPIWFHLLLNKQEQNFVRAEWFAPTMRYLLSQDSAFDEVDIGASQEHDGCILITGVVETNAVLSELKDLITEKNPPAPVIYDVSAVTEMADGFHERK